MMNNKNRIADASTTTNYVINEDTTFYWLPLTFMDRQFLQTAEKYFFKLYLKINKYKK
jgi:hypothetical protein